MIHLEDFYTRGALPLFVAALVIGLATAALSRDLGKRLLGAGVAGVGAVVLFAVMTRHATAMTTTALSAAAILIAGLALGFACLVRVREGFGGVDAGGLRLAEENDDRTERGE